MDDETPRSSSGEQEDFFEVALARRFLDVINGGPAAQDTLAPRVVNHGGIPAKSVGDAAFMDAVATLRRAAPKLRLRYSYAKSYGNMVLTRWTASGVPAAWKESPRDRFLAGGHLLRVGNLGVTQIWTLTSSGVESADADYHDYYYGDSDWGEAPKPQRPWIPPEPTASDPDPAVSADRWIQLQIFDDAFPSALATGDRPLAANTTYAFDVRIGEKRADWLQATKPFPDKLLPANSRTHRLRVVLAEIGGNRAIAERQCDLPPTGASETCRFQVRTGSATWHGRIIVLFRNRVIQTARVRAEVREVAPAILPIEMTIESVLRPALASLASRSEFDAAFVHDQRPGPASDGTAITRDAVVNLVLKRVEPSVRSIEPMLSTVADDPESYGPSLDSEATARLLYKLALHGVTLRGGIFPDGVPDALAPPARIQVLAADPNAYFPIEFVYDFPAPNTPTLCPNAQSALLSGSCDPEKFHRPSADGSIDVVCPVGFWSMSRVIERHVTRNQFAAEDLRGFDYSLRVEPFRGRDELGGLGRAVFAASHKVAEHRIDDLAQTLDEVTASRADRARSWEEWVDVVDTGKPSLLLLLAHTVQDDDAGQTALEIEVSARRVAGRLNKTYVRSRDDTKPPIVLLLGCETAVPYLEYQSFVVAFRDYGAALVVGTVATVPSSHAPDVARALIRELKKPTIRSAKTFGDVLLAARRALLAQGEVMSMCLTAYGDADWRLPASRA